MRILILKNCNRTFIEYELLLQYKTNYIKESLQQKNMETNKNKKQ